MTAGFIEELESYTHQSADDGSELDDELYFEDGDGLLDKLFETTQEESREE
jgi:hypothetical protein